MTIGTITYSELHKLQQKALFEELIHLVNVGQVKPTEDGNLTLKKKY